MPITCFCIQNVRSSKIVCTMHVCTSAPRMKVEMKTTENDCNIKVKRQAFHSDISHRKMAKSGRIFLFWLIDKNLN